MISLGTMRLPIFLALLLVFSVRPVPAATVTIDGSVTNQFIDGFGVNANYWHFDTNELWAPLDALIDQVGMTIFRVVMNNGWEAVNDNNDPTVMNWDYYNQIYSSPEFEKLWSVIAHLNQKGITSGIVLNFQGPGPDWLGGDSLTPGMEDEWAEYVASLLIYARNNRHLQFTLVGPNNESDITGEGIHIDSADQYVLALHKLAALLDTNGLTDIQFVAPDLSGTDPDLLQAMMQDPLVMSKLAHFGLHSYGSMGSGSEGISDLIQSSPYPDRNFWMTEFNVWCSDCEAGIAGDDTWDYSLGTADYLFGHLANGASAGLVWEGYDSWYPHHQNWSFWGLLAVDDINASPKTYTPRKNFYTLAQIAKYVHPGARRIDVNGSSDPIELLAFYHDDEGQFTLVGINADSDPADFSANLDSLPDIASLDFIYTTADTNLALGPSVPVNEGAFSITVPGSCVFTLTGFDPAKIAVSLQITNLVDGTIFPAPTNLLIQASASTSTGSLSTVSFYNGAMKIGESAGPPFDFMWSNASPGNYVLSARATNSVGNTRASTPIRITLTGPVAQLVVSPADAIVAPQGAQQFTAAAFDALGNFLSPQPALSWLAAGGGPIDSNGLFTAGAKIGGPFSITAAAGTISGQALVTITTNVASAGQPYVWYSLTDPTQNTPNSADPGLTDGDLITDVPLLPGGGTDAANALEAAGVIWANTQPIVRVVFRNGSMDSYFDGVFAADLRLQFSSNGVNWADAGPEWVIKPPYTYNSPSSSEVDFVFSGGLVSTKGIRCLGRVHTSEAAFPPNSWMVRAREVQAFIGDPASRPLLAVSQNGPGNIVLSWPAMYSNFLLECSADSALSSWVTITNAPRLTNSFRSLPMNNSGGQKFFRLRKP